MKRTTIFACIALFAVVFMITATEVMAQAQQAQPPTPASRVEELNKVLKLTADQSAKITKILTDAAANAPAGRGGGGGGRMGGGFMSRQTTTDVEAVLTPDQVKQFRAYNLKQSVDRRITQIDQAVTLTADQRKKIVPIIEKEINAQSELTASMQAGGDRQGMMDKMTEIRAATDKALESILTKEQLTKYNAMPRRGGARQR